MVALADPASGMSCAEADAAAMVQRAASSAWGRRWGAGERDSSVEERFMVITEAQMIEGACLRTALCDHAPFMIMGVIRISNETKKGTEGIKAFLAWPETP
ncbi:hypothetical protein GCM10027214_31730 [Stenotrophomonas tumulicola]